MGKKKITEFTKEKLFALAEKYGLDYKQYEECYYFYLPKFESHNNFRNNI